MNLKTTLFKTDRRCLLLLIPLAAVLFSFNMAGWDLWAPDEPDTGEVVREILLNGHWGALTDNNAPFLEKPPLYHWLAALFSLPSGRVTTFALRLPSSLAAFAGVLVLFALGRSMFGRRVGTLAAIVLMTAQKYFFESRWAHVDMLWSALLLCAALCFHEAWRRAGSERAERAGAEWANRRAERSDERGGERRWLLGFYLAIGLAVITKGPLGILLPLLAAGAFLTVTRDLGFVRRMGLTWGLPITLAPAALWLLGWRASGSPYPLDDVLTRLMTRFTTGVHHREPFWATFVNLLVIFLPWTLLLPAAIRQTFPRRGGRPDPQNAYVYTWIVVILAVFALSVEKRAVYLLPVLPFLALLVGRLWDVALLDWEPSVAGRAVGLFLWLNLAAIGIGAAVALPKIERASPDLLPAAVALAAVGLAATVAARLVHRRLGGGAALATLSAGLLTLYLVTAGVAMPALNQYKSARPFSLRVREVAAGAPLAMFPDFRPAYVYYTERFIDVLPDRARLQAYLASGPRVFVLIEESNYESERRHAASAMHVLDREQIGHRAMLLVSNAPSEPGTAPAIEPGAESSERP